MAIQIVARSLGLRTANFILAILLDRFSHGVSEPLIVGLVSSQEIECKFPVSTLNDNVLASSDGFLNLCKWERLTGQGNINPT
ncbi:MAG: hypothetical protein JO297_10045 [Nitrososphaeraceae archaeon]|nr:hypothetical protein [Nitrososphaeraceae archaeon]